MTKAVYALSADPITFGHINIVERSAKIFNEVFVAIGDNPAKKYLFTKEERTKMAQISLAHLPNVKVTFFDGLLIDFAHENDISVMVRGIRNTNDMEYEYNLYQVNDSQDLEIETMCLFTQPELGKVSSSNVKSIQKESGLTQKYVPLVVKDKLEQKISHQKIFGITGIMGSGKSWLANQLVEYSQNKEVKVHNIELDDIAKEILYDSDKPAHLKIRKKLEERFETLDKAEIAKKVFSNKENLEFINELVKKPLLIELRNRIKVLKGVVLVNAAILIESNMLSLVNNNVIMVSVNDETRFENLEKYRNIPKSVARKRIANVLSHEDKVKKVNFHIESEGYGKLVEIENNKFIKNKIKELYTLVSKDLSMVIEKKAVIEE
jgi:pantetheine-phosphate adenylyltransferase